MSMHAPSDRKRREGSEGRSLWAPFLLGFGLGAVAALGTLAWSARREQRVEFASGSLSGNRRLLVHGYASPGTHGPDRPPPPPPPDL